MQMEYDATLVRDGIVIFILAVVFHLVCMLVGIVTARLLKVPEQEKGIWVFVCMFSNNGFMGFPLALTLYGKSGMFLMSIANVVTNFLIFSVGVRFMLMGYEIKEKINLRKMVVNNINIAVVLGLICYFSQVRLPGMILDTLEYVGNITAGLSMIVVGLSMAKLDIRQMLKGRNAYLFVSFDVYAADWYPAFDDSCPSMDAGFYQRPDTEYPDSDVAASRPFFCDHPFRKISDQYGIRIENYFSDNHLLPDYNTGVYARNFGVSFRAVI